MSEWKVSLTGLAREVRETYRNTLVCKCNTGELAEQIVREHNSHDALVEALKEFVDHFGDPFKKARAALKLAGE